MKRPRLSFWLFATAVLIVLIVLLQPQQIPISLYKISLVSMAGVAGYWLDRGLFPYARPDGYLALPPCSRYASKRRCDKQADFPIAKGYAQVFAAAMIRRAIIVGAAMLTVGMGA